MSTCESARTTRRAALCWTRKFADQGLRETSQERVAIVNACEYERNSKSFGGIISEVVANSTNTSDFQESSFADEIDVFSHRDITVYVETKVPV